MLVCSDEGLYNKTCANLKINVKYNNQNNFNYSKDIPFQAEIPKKKVSGFLKVTILKFYIIRYVASV